MITNPLKPAIRTILSSKWIWDAKEQLKSYQLHSEQVSLGWKNFKSKYMFCIHLKLKNVLEYINPSHLLTHQIIWPFQNHQPKIQIAPNFPQKIIGDDSPSSTS